MNNGMLGTPGLVPRDHPVLVGRTRLRRWYLDPPVMQHRVATNITTSSSYAVTMPDGVQAGDRLFVLIAGNVASVPGAPAGWATLANSSANGHAIYWRIATGTEGATQTFTSSGSLSGVAQAIRVSGVGNEAWGSAQSANGSTPVTNGCLGLLNDQVPWMSLILCCCNNAMTASQVPPLSTVGANLKDYTEFVRDNNAAVSTKHAWSAYADQRYPAYPGVPASQGVGTWTNCIWVSLQLLPVRLPTPQIR